MRFEDLNVEEFRVNVQGGATDPKLAVLYGVSSQTIMRWRRKVGIESHYEPERAKCGTYSSYSRGCRCVECTEANRKRHAEVVAVMRASGLPEGDPRHGTYAAYTQWACRCAACVQAGAIRNRERYVDENGEYSPFFWREEEDAVIRTRTPSEAATELGRTLSAIYGRRYRLGITS